MKLKKITISNYRQFENLELNFDENLTILAGANNSGKTSLISLLKNIFISDKNNYNEYDIPAKKVKLWLDSTFPLFKDFFYREESIEQLYESLIKKMEDDEKFKLDTTEIRVHTNYDKDKDDIKFFVDYIMDLDEDENSFYFMYSYDVNFNKFKKNIENNFDKIKRRFLELNAPTSSPSEHKERYLKQLIVKLYIDSIIPVCYFCDRNYQNKSKIDEIKNFKNLFNFYFIKASRPLDDEESDSSHTLSKQMIKTVKLSNEWNNLIEQLPDELLKPIQERRADELVKERSLNSIRDTIKALEETNGGQSGELMLDMNITEDNINDLLQKATTATYKVDEYYLSESSQGLGYSNMIYIHLQLKEFENSKDDLKINIFFIEEPESHMHPQMQKCFLKYILEYYKNANLQGMITTHSNEMVRVAGIKYLRVIRRSENSKSNLYDLSILTKDSNNFFDWFFEIGYSEIVFADKAIFYEGDTERLYIQRLLTNEKYRKLNQQYISYIQVGGAYAYKYKKLIELLEIKSLIITDIDYEKDSITISEILESTITNSTIQNFYGDTIKNNKQPKVKDLYLWVKEEKNILNNMIYIAFQSEEDGYTRTLEEAMLSKYYNKEIDILYTKSELEKIREESKLKFSVPKNKEQISLRDILISSKNNKTDFMYSVILNNLVEDMEPEYIHRGLKWLMN